MSGYDFQHVTVWPSHGHRAHAHEVTRLSILESGVGAGENKIKTIGQVTIIPPSDRIFAAVVHDIALPNHVTFKWGGSTLVLSSPDDAQYLPSTYHLRRKAAGLQHVSQLAPVYFLAYGELEHLEQRSFVNCFLIRLKGDAQFSPLRILLVRLQHGICVFTESSEVKLTAALFNNDYYVLGGVVQARA